jgi:hypothetical protein
MYDRADWDPPREPAFDRPVERGWSLTRLPVPVLAIVSWTFLVFAWTTTRGGGDELSIAIGIVGFMVLAIAWTLARSKQPRSSARPTAHDRVASRAPDEHPERDDERGRAGWL